MTSVYIGWSKTNLCVKNSRFTPPPIGGIFYTFFLKTSLMSSPRYGFSTPYRLTNRNSAGLLHQVHIHIGDLHFVLPALNLSSLDAGILIIVQQVRLVMFLLNMVDHHMSFLLLST